MTVYRLRRREAPAIGSSSSTPDPLASDGSLRDGAPGLSSTVELGADAFEKLFLTSGTEYVGRYFRNRANECRVVTHPAPTVTCYEKALMLGDFSPLDVIKTLCFENPETAGLWGFVVPETGCFLDRAAVRRIVGSADQPRVARTMPSGMSVGTCSPFLTAEHLAANASPRVEGLVFDRETLVLKRNERTLDDYSFNDDKRLSIQMNSFDCFDMLREQCGDVVVDREVLTTSFKETFVRRKGRLTVTYEIASISYRMASVTHSLHAGGDVTVTNDYADELDLPEFPAFRRRPPD